MINLLLGFNEWGALALRLIFGIIFLAHGWAKMKNLKATQEWFDSVGFKPGVFWGTLVAFVETFGSLAIIFGLYAQIAAALLAIVMINAILWKVRTGQKLVGGFELDLILLGVAVFLATNAAGLLFVR